MDCIVMTTHILTHSHSYTLPHPAAEPIIASLGITAEVEINP